MFNNRRSAIAKLSALKRKYNKSKKPEELVLGIGKILTFSIERDHDSFKPIDVYKYNNTVVSRQDAIDILMDRV